MQTNENGPKRPLRVLVVEDDYLQSEQIAQGIRDGGDVVVGPFSDVYKANHYVRVAQAAILDVKIQDHNSFLIADYLIKSSVPFVFFTGYGQNIIPSRFEGYRVYQKPGSVATLLHNLHQQRFDFENSGTVDIEKIVLDMIFLAQEIMPDQASAERLVEGAMHQAIRKANNGTFKGNTRQQIKILLLDEYRLRASQHLN